MSELIHLIVQEPEPINLTAEEIAIIKAVSPTVTTEQITGGWKITITDVDGPHVITLYNGADGRGISSAVLNADYTLTITYTDGTSYTTPSIRGERGAGITSIVKTSTSGLVDTYTITYGDGQTATFTVTNGRNGTDGQNGVTFTPSVSASGMLSWSNDGGKPNPDSYDILAAVLAVYPAAEGVSF